MKTPEQRIEDIQKQLDELKNDLKGEGWKKITKPSDLNPIGIIMWTSYDEYILL